MVKTKKIKNKKKGKKLPKSIVKKENDLQVQVSQIASQLNNMSRQFKPLQRAGERIGGFFGFPNAGRAIGGLLGNIVGSGDYKVNFSNIKNNNMLGSNPPVFGNHRCRISRKEYISDVISATSSNSFKIDKYVINPGQYITFPLLSTMAQTYEEYYIHGMIFEFKSTSGNSVGSTNTAIGTVILATEYDVTKPDFASKFQMENYEFAQSVKAADSVMHAVECKQSENPLSRLYVRTIGQQTNQDLRLNDLGNFYIASTGMQNGSINLGELWVSYDIEFFKPRFNTYSTAVFSFHTSRNSITQAEPFGTATNYNSGTLSPTFSNSGTSRVMSWRALPGQNYFMSFTWTGAANVAGLGPPSTTATGITFYNSFNNVTSASSNASGVLNTVLAWQLTGSVSLSAGPTTVSVTFANNGGFPLAANCLDIFVCSIDATINQ